ncbi:MAG: adenylosuccinate synthase [Clostridiales bacterium]|nr:adenylosuccinate synthase [Clostridiales bacterium]
MLTAIAGINWGDEGKGRMVDLLSENYDIVVRYQGGNNAGHTVINHLGKFILNLLPSGILRPEVVNVMGNGMVIDLKHLCGEIERLTAAGVKITPENLKISDKAIICMPYHVILDGLEEDRLGDAKYGSTRRGIAPVYGDKYMKKGIRMGDLFHLTDIKDHLKGIVSFKNLSIQNIYNSEPVKFEDMVDYLETYGGKLKDFICDTSIYLDQAEKDGKKIMFEAQLGALRDIDFGIYPFTSSSSTIAAYAPIGAGIPNHKLTNVYGIMKAYSSCVGEGPFTCEMFGKEADELREAGGEYGAATGRPRRVGGFDIVASRYGVRMQGADEIALTKLDVLSYLKKIPVCVAYDINGNITKDFPTGTDLDIAKPVYEYLPGWNSDISNCRKFKDLPSEAIDYIRYIEKEVDCKIKYISVGAEREAYIVQE